ncbi:c-type cytochrome biogenesis protein CcmI [Roseovarius sp.]|jgi:cytochrome c-type biogenesis protein CcmH|uniref:c-type cytochrome biogenesis protein CcmI n=1 Tax=Roseovarius sp. TaxID=1486281 RepID=UPI002615F405|nr:c-type cytochrome biogenesis protein CcmI [Roseovarius sp.]MDM8165262.1 c-type cytochrome biogenesis protein CcmI [Roseovarius sp.]
MLFWIIVSAIALFCGAILGVAVLRGRAGEEPPAAYDLRVYRDQLKEVDRDLARGVINEEDAERLRAEVSRRILAADAKLREGGESGGQPGWAGWAVTGLAVAGLGGGALLLYSELGAPGYTDVPLKGRIAASDAARANRQTQVEAEARMPEAEMPSDVSEEFLALMEKLRETVEKRPEDQRGLQLLVRNEAALGDLKAAYAAQRQLIEVKGDAATAGDYALLTDLMVSAAGGYISQEAEEAIRAALELEPREPRARYYLGLYYMQVDRPDAAFRTWRALLEESRPGAPWVPLIRSRIEEVAWRAGVEYQLPEMEEAPGPSAEDVEAAGELSDADRGEMIRGMVTRLSERLASEGGTAQEWARLIGAHGVLGETEQARAIWQEAQQVFEGREAELEILRAAAREAGVLE